MYIICIACYSLLVGIIERVSEEKVFMEIFQLVKQQVV